MGGEDTGAMLLDMLRQTADMPVVLFAAIVAATFVLEDAATAGAAVLAAEGVLHPGLGLAALYVGILCGDLGLYGLGYVAAGQPWLRDRIGVDRLRQGEAWLSKRLVLTLFAARSLPGMRLPTYTASGFLRVSFTKFAAIAMVAAAIWTTVLFTLIYLFGQVAAQVLGDWSWIVGLGLLMAALLLPRLIAKRFDVSPPNGAQSP